MPSPYCLAFTASALLGCALPEPKIVASSELGTVYRVWCDDTPSDCVAAAADQCHDAARLVRNHSGRRMDTPVYWLEFICAKPGDEVADEDKPHVLDGWAPTPPKSRLTRRLEAEQAAEDEEDRRRALRALGAALGGFAAGFSAGASAASPPTVATPAPPSHPATCTSDYGCGLGFMCSKREGANVGECLRAVNRFGAPTYVHDPAGHTGPGENQCAGGCPPGFRCDFGRCIQ